ncbi:MAG: hypothetical protein IIY49_05825 [Eubacterium sp.]|nr:hypothetical protein [Eubacterium sp.]
MAKVGFFEKKKISREIEDIILLIVQDVANNYKDNAKVNLKKLSKTVENYRRKDKLEDKDFGRYMNIIKEYEDKLSNWKRTY